MDVTIEEIEDLSIRTYAVLKRNNINFVSQIKEMSYAEITSLKNIHRHSVEELEEKLNIEFK
ncbi:DNA-directed RNA polymerase subunit alpha C-terminal domain-containing protein [Paenibacillus dendritiformis]|uniref:DNA-directed RNA polymerase subunit alpha C-terminal domain-containing protein n=1 Tax=Paenibacillus dendritiformis TaxID=130049 RepID=UPI00387E0770